MKNFAILALAAVTLGGCITTSGCPSLKGYTSAQMKAVATELAANPNSATAAFIGDYGQLRAACRAMAGN